LAGLFATIEAPVSEALPCGPNPDDDPEFEGFIAAAQGQLPTSYFQFAKDAAARAALDVPAQLALIAALLERSRDIRLLVFAAKFSILAGDIAGFAEAIGAISKLLSERWEHVYPQGHEGDFALRNAYISSLDDMSSTVLPLQYAVLVNDRRLGSITYRTHLISTGAAQPREGETGIDSATLREALVKVDLDSLKLTYEAVAGAGTALKEIKARFGDQAGFEQAPDFEQLMPIVQGITALLSEVLQERDPSLALKAQADQAIDDTPSAEADGGEKPAAAAPIVPPKSVSEAANALKAIESYYAAFEPSSPAVLLVRQAQQLIGKSFVEAMQMVAPTLMDKASIRIGGEAPFALTFAQLKTLTGQGAAPAAASTEPVPSVSYKVSTRREAASVMELVERFYRQSEPSSPIPLLLERARLFVDRDFASLLKDLLKPAG